MKNIEEMISVMEEAKEGKKIQIRNVGSIDWFDIDTLPIWNWREYDYRVKPGPKLRPYANAQEFICAMHEHGLVVTHNEGKSFYMPEYMAECSVILRSDGIEYVPYNKLLKDFFWQDGTPCGVVEEGGEQ